MFSNDTISEGPIPARAGEPHVNHGGRLRLGAYPRSRGGTAKSVPLRYFLAGLSPLARGNPLVFELAAKGAGPIPARAGEPGCRKNSGMQAGAYPRSRGGTWV